MNNLSVEEKAVLDFIVKTYTTGFESFDNLINAEGNYKPTLNCQNKFLKILADYYDDIQSSRNDSRRIFRSPN